MNSSHTTLFIPRKFHVPFPHWHISYGLSTAKIYHRVQTLILFFLVWPIPFQTNKIPCQNKALKPGLHHVSAMLKVSSAITRVTQVWIKLGPKNITFQDQALRNQQMSNALPETTCKMSGNLSLPCAHTLWLKLTDSFEKQTKKQTTTKPQYICWATTQYFIFLWAFKVQPKALFTEHYSVISVKVESSPSWYGLHDVPYYFKLASCKTLSSKDIHEVYKARSKIWHGKIQAKKGKKYSRVVDDKLKHLAEYFPD